MPLMQQPSATADFRAWSHQLGPMKARFADADTVGHCQARRGRQRRKLWAVLLLTLARDLVPERPGRREPRAVKRRPKYDRLNRPRAQYRDRPRRSVRRTLANNKRLI
jgi:hypothetical protein